MLTRPDGPRPRPSRPRPGPSMLESSSKSRKSWDGLTDDLAVHSRYLKQQRRMIWRLPWWLYVGEQILTKMKKSGVLASVNIVR